MSVVHTDFPMIPKFFRRADKKNSSAPSSEPTPKSIDGVPEKLTKYFSHQFGPDVEKFHLEKIPEYHVYGILTRSGKKYYFQMQNLKDGVLKIKVCPTDTTERVLFYEKGPSDIDEWTLETLNTDEQKESDVFYIKNPNDYFTEHTLNQNIWPMDKVHVSLSQSFSNERNPYFI